MAEEYKTGKVFAMYSDGHAVKVGTTKDDAEWCDVVEEIQKYVDNSYKDADVRYKVRLEGKRRKIYVLFKQDDKGKAADEKPTGGTGFTCEDCGKELKDGKYKKCYMCGKKNPKSKPEKEEGRSNEYWDKRNELMSKQWSIRTAAIAIQKLEGNVPDLETLQQQIVVLADKFYNQAHGII